MLESDEMNRGIKEKRECNGVFSEEQNSII